MIHYTLCIFSDDSRYIPTDTKNVSQYFSLKSNICLTTR